MFYICIKMTRCKSTRDFFGSNISSARSRFSYGIILYITIAMDKTGRQQEKSRGSTRKVHRSASDWRILFFINPFPRSDVLVCFS